MGGKSKSKSKNTSQQTSQTMNNLSKGKTSNREMMNLQGNLQTSLLNAMFPAFGAMVKDGMSSFADNPMAPYMGAALGMPMKVQTPQFMTEFFDKYQAEQEPQVAPQQPQVSQYGVNPYQASPFGYRPNRRGGMLS